MVMLSQLKLQRNAIDNEISLSLNLSVKNISWSLETLILKGCVGWAIQTISKRSLHRWQLEWLAERLRLAKFLFFIYRAKEIKNLFETCSLKSRQLKVNVKVCLYVLNTFFMFKVISLVRIMTLQKKNIKFLKQGYENVQWALNVVSPRHTYWHKKQYRSLDKITIEISVSRSTSPTISRTGDYSFCT